ncbi:MAG: DUF5011 domain-containing protein [Candidatus Pacebacteria bacterium]|nr:DUF5011 domain-containing protein [Candidatus Paceibacterota bacterium]MBP9851889.1 DUF5011 domain-containing protein [Candidatus Paceibacterota bacterium]
MKKNIFTKTFIVASLAVFTLAAGIFTVKAVGPNLIGNADLEASYLQEDGTPTPTGWSHGAPSQNTAVYTYVDDGGSKAIKVAITDYIDGDAKWYFTPVPVEAGSLYRFSNSYKSDATTYLFAEYTYANTPPTYEQIAVVSPSATWTTGTMDFTPPAGTVSVSVLHMLKGVGELTTDNYSLAQLNTANENQFSTGIVSVTFDDGWLNQYTAASPILSTAGMKASYYVMSGTTLNNEFGYMTASQLSELQADNNEIGGHTINHCNLTLLPSVTSCAFAPEGGTTTVENEIQGSKNALTSLGYMISTFAYPNGGYNDSIKNVMASNASAARSIDAGFNTRFSDKYALKTQVVDTTVPMATILGWIDSAATNKTWLILTFHQVAPLDELQANNDEGGVTPENFQIIIDHIKAVRDGATNPIRVMTVTSVLPEMANSTVDPVDPLDTLAPVIVLNGDATMSIVAGTSYTDAGATATDNVDGNLTSSIVATGAVINTTVAGTYVVSYNVADAAGNNAPTVTRTVTVTAVPTENTIPVITLNGNETVTLTLGSTYTDAGATATDAEDGDITASIVRTGSVDTNTANTYPITYTVTDSNGGVATTVTRTVVVQGNSNSGGGGGGGGGSSGGGSYVPVVPVVPVTPVTPTTPGSVLGSTCNAIIVNNISFHNGKNKVEDVKKLQAFLNKHMNAKLPVTGFYGTMTLSAVKNFQMKYKSEILTPVKLTKGNGNVFTLTRAKINALSCVAN